MTAGYARGGDRSHAWRRFSSDTGVPGRGKRGGYGRARGPETGPRGGLRRVVGRRAQPIITILRPNTG